MVYATPSQIADELGTSNWVVANRRTARLAKYKVVLSPAAFSKLNKKLAA